MAALQETEMRKRPHRNAPKLKLERFPMAARRSPRVSAPKLSSRRATAATNLRSPPRLELMSLKMGPVTWLDRCERPSCWIALSALQGSSMVQCTRRRWFLNALSTRVGKTDGIRWERVSDATHH